MKLLLTNDDGIHAEGIKSLSKTLSSCHDIYIVAPEREMSATGHAITLHKPLRAEELEIEGSKRAWAVNGTPSDCVKLAIETILEKKPDLVISGTNKGSNMGNDIFYSGTVSAALEGYFMGLPAIAISLAVIDEKPDYSYTSSFLKGFLQSCDSILQDKQLLLNINIPCLPADSIKGVKITALGRRSYLNTIEKRVDPRGRTYYWVAGQAYDEGEERDSDIVAVTEGYISVTPLSVNLTDHDARQELQKYDF